MNDLEEDIKLLEKVCQRPIEETEGTKILKQAIENLINKYKELLEKVNYLEKIRANQHDEIEDKESIIKLMAKDIAENKLDEDICRQVKDPNNEDCYTTLYYDHACSDCVIEYYEKKAKGE